MERGDFEKYGTDGVIMTPVPGTFFKVCASNEAGSSVAFNAKYSYGEAEKYMEQLQASPEESKYTDWYIMRMDNFVHMQIVTGPGEFDSWPGAS